MKNLTSLSAAILLLATLYPYHSTAKTGESDAEIDLRKSHLYNETAYIPSQCYTKTKVKDGPVGNTCYVCHTRSIQPNYINDHDLQQEFSLPEPGLSNPWKNLFEDRRQRIDNISDADIISYISKNNYLDEKGAIRLAGQLDTLPVNWDYNGNGRWDGYTPDCYFNFDEEGFDRNPQGKDTGWRAFAYYPFPGNSWPTNGSTDDIIIRLAESLRQDSSGNYDREIYRVNLAIVEALIKQENVAINPVNEKKFGVDLDKNGRLNSAETVVYEWDPRRGKNMSYVGLAEDKLAEGELHLAAGLFPEGTEFLNSIRYIGVDVEKGITLAPRMKELRYMKKRTWQTYSDLEEAALAEMKERDDFPDRTRQLIGNAEQGINNGSGWLLQGFIEDSNGDLRPQDFEETVSCVGCHGGVGITTDSVYGFPRKLDAAHHQNGWYHWSQKGMQGLAEPKIEIHGSGVYYEYSYYLMYNTLGSEFRHNPELAEKFYNPDGSVKMAMLDKLHDDITLLLHPTPKRALLLNKAYRTIVSDQDFHQGRDVNVAPLTATVYEEVTQDEPTGVQQTTSIDDFRGHFGPRCNSLAATTPQLNSSLQGKGMPGPSGIPYETDWQGVIHKSRYAMDIQGVHFTFPDRLTLPTRVIVPIGKNPSCYSCHRLGYPTVPGNTDNKIMFDPAETNGKATHPAGTKQLTASAGQDQNGLWSPDGKRIAFVSDRTGTSHIWLMDADGSNVHQLSSGEEVHAWPEWSPDGRSIVAWSFDPQNSTYNIKLFTLENGSGKTLVSSRQMLDRPTFHPDGSMIAYGAQTRGNWDIWLLTLPSGDVTRLTSKPLMETNPHWTDDGKVLSYKVAPTTGAYNLTGENFMTFENGYTKPVIHKWQGPESVQMNDWSPDGAKITYTAEVISNASGKERVSYAAMVSDLHLEKDLAKTTNDRLLTNGCSLGDRGPVFSPDGSKIAFWAWNTDNTASIWLYDVADDHARQLTSGGLDMYPQWSPDGSTLLFETNLEGQIDLMAISISSP